MGFLGRRRRKFEKLLNGVENLLIEKGVTPVHYFKDRNLLNYLTCKPFNSLLDSLKLTTVNINLERDEKAFVDFMARFYRLTAKRMNLLLDSPPEKLYFDSPILGWRDNPRYEEELELYRRKLDEYRHKKVILDKKRRELWDSEDGETARHVEKEERAALCPKCGGAGEYIPSEEEEPLPEMDPNMGTGARSGAYWNNDASRFTRRPQPRMAIDNGEDDSFLDTGNAEMDPENPGNGTAKIPMDDDFVPGEKKTECPQCGGTGKSGYVPQVTSHQRIIADIFRNKMEALKEPVFTSFPCRKRAVFIRLSYEGQVFIKDVLLT